jgi:hypothetical protein
MRIMCKHCGGKARISSSDRISIDFTRLYCQCSDVKECGHTFVMELGFSHTLNPPSSVIDQLLLNGLGRCRQNASKNYSALLVVNTGF